MTAISELYGNAGQMCSKIFANDELSKSGNGCDSILVRSDRKSLDGFRTLNVLPVKYFSAHQPCIHGISIFGIYYRKNKWFDIE